MPFSDTSASLEEHRFPCDQCGADYRFDPAAGRLVCDHCGNSEDVAQSGPWESSIRELDFRSALAQDLPAQDIEETRVSTCPNCGAQVEFDADVHAAECPFCATPVVTDTGTHRHIKPKGLLPFALDEDTARKAMTDWLGRLWFAPGGLKEYARKGRRMQGIYVPYWTFDADTRSAYRGERGTVYYETRTVTRNGKRERVRVAKVRWRAVSGRGGTVFRRCAGAGLAQPAQEVHRRAGAVGFVGAQSPTTPNTWPGSAPRGIRWNWKRGSPRPARSWTGSSPATCGSTSAATGSASMTSRPRSVTSPSSMSCCLVWLAAYKYRGQTYRFVVNGRTGRVQGERPWSAWKIALAAIAALLVGAVVGYVVAKEQGVL